MRTEPTTTEAQFQNQVIQLARMFGWRVAHFRPAQTARGWRTPVQGDGEGFPDLVMIHEEKGRQIAAELKSEKGQPTAEQYCWLLAYEVAGVETYLWRPSDFDEIAEVLKR